VGNRRFLGASIAFARLSSRSALSVFFSLPFDEPGMEFHACIEFLKAHTPFRLSDQRWKIWTLNKRGTRYVGRRLTLKPEGSESSPGR